MPYLLNQAAEKTSLEFQKYYRLKYGMLRTEWRVLFHLGRYGALTAKAICDRAGLHKTKVSRAVAALETRRFIQRNRMEQDRRQEVLTLTRAGENAFDDLVAEAARYNTRLMQNFSAEDAETVRRILLQITAMETVQP
ncbi:MarR family transcriptional regulator [Marivita sp. S6314]|uniref:MarR family winged helix-turn-helix transcriptional regulator n=1 Tax=Marivita sp. S6314 TaxID=2926406 RepID=UPI001FF5121A|nr:MarR family transcriptional regulator [Marivita sp. S6314]MCK0149734.1 MarR family transcriptional regulator [Marivita sp. S6314]